MSNCMPLNNTPIGMRCASRPLTMAQNVLAGLTAKMLATVPRFSVNLVTGIPATDCRWSGCEPRRRVAGFSLFCRLGAMPMVVCAAKKLSHNTAYPEKPADLSSHSWLEYSVRPDNEFELIAPEGIDPPIPQGRFRATI